MTIIAYCILFSGITKLFILFSTSQNNQLLDRENYNDLPINTEKAEKIMKILIIGDALLGILAGFYILNPF